MLLLFWSFFALFFNWVESSEFPLIPPTLPSGTSRLAFDEDRNLLIAFNSLGQKLGQVEPLASNLARRDDSGCTPLNIADLKNLPGWQALAAAAATDFGDGQYNLVTNPPQYPNETASVCISTDTIQLSQSGSPSCTTSSQSTASTSVGSSGSVSLTSSPGSNFQTTITVTQPAGIVAGFQASAPVQIPAVDPSSALTQSVSFENTGGQSTTTPTNNQQSQQVSVSSAQGSNCQLNFKTTSCTISGTGQVVYTATGWAWFNYLNVTQGHYKWALNMDATLTEDQRSSSMNFNANIKVDTNADYTSECSSGSASSTSSISTLSSTASSTNSGSSTSSSSSSSSSSLLSTFAGGTGSSDSATSTINSSPGSTNATNATNTADPSDSTSTTTSNHSAIIGGAVGGSVAAALVLLALVCFFRCRRHGTAQELIVSPLPYAPVSQTPVMTEYTSTGDTSTSAFSDRPLRPNRPTSTMKRPLPQSDTSATSQRSRGATTPTESAAAPSETPTDIRALQAEVSELRRALQDRGRSSISGATSSLWVDEPPPLYETH